MLISAPLFFVSVAPVKLFYRILTPEIVLVQTRGLRTHHLSLLIVLC